MLLRYKKAAKRTVTFLVVGLVFAIFAPSAFAECGPGFSSKSHLIQVIKHNPGIAHGMRKELLAEPKYEYQADETVLNYVRQSNQEVFNAPSGYMLTANTYCPGGYGDYQPYGSLLENMSGKALLWHCDKEGKNCIPILKGYCMNFVHGPPVKKHHPPRHHPHKCGCHHHRHHHHKPKVICHQGQVGIGNGCSPQTVNQRQECEVHSGSWNENTLVCVQVGQNGVCSAQSGVVNGNNNTVNQEVKCGSTTEICVGTNVCNTPPPEEPCGCKEKPTIKITSMIELNMIPAERNSGPVNIGTYASESGGTLTVDPGIGSVSSCSSENREASTTTSVPSGASEQCVIIYPPENDADKPEWMTVTVTACLGSVCDTRVQKVKVTYPIRP